MGSTTTENAVGVDHDHYASLRRQTLNELSNLFSASGGSSERSEGRFYTHVIWLELWGKNSKIDLNRFMRVEPGTLFRFLDGI